MSIGIFGGTFDPIHSAHLTVAAEAADAFGLDRVLFIPASHPPHKSELGCSSFEHRFRMVELACQSDPRFAASRIEEGIDPSYSIDTVERLLVRESGLYFIIGADAFADIEKWHRWRELAALVEFIVVTRPGHEYAIPEGVRVRRLNTLALPVSSSEIRQQLARGVMPPELPAAVGEYIRRNELYEWPAPAPRLLRR